ncbi:hypothetical protein [Flammeovirga sp. SJP92]|uniref:hypothetical protein n=1 Tax=Flammeovirga sp. SJP92 TaxID=1775430 RepID=UPI000788292E|nr:hypothetical protein [Flammeovirga sp. SJP92]KXX70037.1 hypothetical protein AVL50_14280 [Flammeovirga sp. SJP92]
MSIFSILLLIIGIFLHRRKNASLYPLIYDRALLVKLIMGLLLGYLYSTYFKGGDTFILHADSVKLAEIAKTNFSGYLDFVFSKPYYYPPEIKSQLMFSNSSTVYFTILGSILSLICFGNYWIMSLYMSFFSFCGFWFLLKRVKQLYPTTAFSFLIANLCFPTIIFWSSGVIKEALALPFLYFSLGLSIDLITRKIKLAPILALLFSLYSLLQLKFYYFGGYLLFFVPLLFFMYLKEKKTRFSKKYILILFSLIIVGGIFMINFEYHFNLDRFPQTIYDNYQKLSLNEQDTYAIHLEKMSNTWEGILLSAPEAMLTPFLYPNYFTSRHLFDVIISSENLLVLLLMLMNVYLLITGKTKISRSNLLMTGLLLAYSLCTIAFLAIASPNLGSLSRYKIGASVFLYYILIIQLEAFFKKRLGNVDVLI